MGEKRGISLKVNMSIDQVLEYLDNLKDSLKTGTVYVEHGTEIVALQPEGSVQVKVEASQKKEKEKFKLEISWRRTPRGTSAPELKISSKSRNEP